jgi:hydrogenase maturation protease
VTTCVVALGQPLAGDDGVGLVVLERLRSLELPSSVQLHAARDATALIELATRATRLIVVDALVDAGAGRVQVLRPEELEAGMPSAVSSHGVSVGHALALARSLSSRCADDVRIVGIGIDRPRAIGSSLSPAVEAALPHAVEAVRGLIMRSASRVAVDAHDESVEAETAEQ